MEKTRQLQSSTGVNEKINELIIEWMNDWENELMSQKFIISMMRLDTDVIQSDSLFWPLDGGVTPAHNQKLYL